MRTFRLLFLSLCLSFLSPSLLFAEESAMVNINTADVSQLTSLIGVGQSKAEAIVAYRETYGEFQAVDELVAVKGIGESLLSKNRNRIVVNNDKVVVN
ncbi:ComEA family DNA-binding protein [Oceanicoccus sp. KOV_DT_Chl]|uniref:ComEA family DNA-binding protein n=1 Tax=Oceanicoccus sp. KOV_DT_Chl TaxID=1904639 RepID=UPI000C7BFB58|nr:ComEA family DNA-binding protein [Oceanicoccus sp. KOV_DT_Chl]